MSTAVPGVTDRARLAMRKDDLEWRDGSHAALLLFDQGREDCGISAGPERRDAGIACPVPFFREMNETRTYLHAPEKD